MNTYDVWVSVNSERFVCKTCDFRTHNHYNYKLHRNTNKCWLQRHMRELPYNVAVLISLWVPHCYNSWYYGYLAEPDRPNKIISIYCAGDPSYKSKRDLQIENRRRRLLVL